MSEWQSMETAPKDGRPVLLRLNSPLQHKQACLAKLLVTIGFYATWSDVWFSAESHYMEEEWYAPDYEGATPDVNSAGIANTEVHPTGWMPLPEP